MYRPRKCPWPEPFAMSPDLERREDFGSWLNGRGLTGEAVEIGTHRGDFALQLLEKWRGCMLRCVDPYLPGGEWSGEDRNKDRLEAARRLAIDDRAALHVETSEEFAVRCAGTPLDFVYLDGDHTTQGVMCDMLAWWPKLRPGGVLAGHDITGGWGPQVRSAVWQLADDAGLTAFLVPGVTASRRSPLGRYASWYVIKPEE